MQEKMQKSAKKLAPTVGLFCLVLKKVDRKMEHKMEEKIKKAGKHFQNFHFLGQELIVSSIQHGCYSSEYLNTHNTEAVIYHHVFFQRITVSKEKLHDIFKKMSKLSVLDENKKNEKDK